MSAAGAAAPQPEPAPAPKPAAAAALERSDLNVPEPAPAPTAPAPAPEPETVSEPFDANPSQVVAEDDEDGYAAPPASSRDTRYDGDPVSGSYVEDEGEEESEDAWDLTGRGPDRY